MKKDLLAVGAALLFAPSGILTTQATAQTLSDYAVYADGEANLGTVIITGTVAGRPVDTAFSSIVSGGTTASSDALSAQAVSYSSAFAATPLTPGTSFGGSPNATLTGAIAGTNVYSLTGVQWEALSNLSFAGLGSGAIVNVGGMTLTNAFNIDLGALAASDVVFNFYEATSLNFGGGHNFYGTILAPNAHVKLTNMTLYGAVISDTFESPNSIINHQGFTGFIAAVPEPGTWATVILGFALVGGASRRRTRATAARFA
jgi:choice-of-anchor A domain-containing protein